MFAVAAFINCGQAGIGIGVAGPRTVAQFANSVIGAIFNFAVFLGFIVASMATGTIRLVAAVGPGGCLAVGTVAVAAANARFVVTGITGAGMSETG